MKHWQTLLIQSTPHSNWDDDDDDDDNDDDDNDSEGDSSDGDDDDEDSNNDTKNTRHELWNEGNEGRIKREAKSER